MFDIGAKTTSNCNYVRTPNLQVRTYYRRSLNSRFQSRGNGLGSGPLGRSGNGYSVGLWGGVNPYTIEGNGSTVLHCVAYIHTKLGILFESNFGLRV